MTKNLAVITVACCVIMVFFSLFHVSQLHLTENSLKRDFQDYEKEIDVKIQDANTRLDVFSGRIAECEELLDEDKFLSPEIQEAIADGEKWDIYEFNPDKIIEPISDWEEEAKKVCIEWIFQTGDDEYCVSWSYE